jgi:predicted TIM-barrel fold metal-dependent hydrolase
MIKGIDMDKNIDFVDAHFHLWDLNELHYGWLTDQAMEVHPVIGDYSDIQKSYLLNDYLSDAKKSGLTKAVHVQAAIGIDDPVEETRWLQDVFDASRFPGAIIGYVDLRDKNYDELLSRHCEFSRFRGIRMMEEEDSFYSDGRFLSGLKSLGKRNLIFDLDIGWQLMPEAFLAARKNPDLLFVLEHTGFPKSRSLEYFASWKKNLKLIAQAENVVCKISGLAMVDHNWNLESFTPWVREAIEVFGPERCMFATNFPVDKLFGSFDAIVKAYKDIVEDFSFSEKEMLFSKNAEKFYRI